MTRLEQELSDLKQDVRAMGALAQAMVDDSWQAIVRQDQALTDRVLASEPRLDRLQVEIDAKAVRLITLFAPVARDLRFLLTIARITSELERMGDQAVDNCEYGLVVAPPLRPTTDLSRMADFVISMVRDAVQALADEQPDRADAVMRRDTQVDALYSQVFRELLAYPQDRTHTSTGITGLVLLARSLERIADHATNVCEEVFYFVEGADVRHQAFDDRHR